MSSHHIVRDQQEPALLVLTGTVSFALVGELLEWSPTVLVAEPALETVRTWGIKFDGVLCVPAHQADLRTELNDHQPLVLIPVEENSTWLERAADWLAAHQHRNTYVLVDTVAPEMLASTTEVQFTFVDPQYKTFRVSESGYEKWVPAGRRFRWSGQAATHNLRPTKEPDVWEAIEAGLVRIGPAPGANGWLQEGWDTEEKST